MKNTSIKSSRSAGGRARARALSAKRRRAIASKAGRARWAKATSNLNGVRIDRGVIPVPELGHKRKATITLSKMRVGDSVVALLRDGQYRVWRIK